VGQWCWWLRQSRAHCIIEGEPEGRLGVMIEDLDKKISAIAHLVQRDDEKVEEHERRIRRLGDHAGLPTLEPVVE
jgi:hypothetical protein